ncbi:MAG: EamA family transporter, partial [Verrucomicrobiales bacterium]
ISRFDWETLGWSSVGLLTAAAIAAGYGQLALTQGFRLLKVSTGASIQMALPVFTTLGGILLFGETFSVPQLAGGALTIFGAWRVVVGRR